MYRRVWKLADIDVGFVLESLRIFIYQRCRSLLFIVLSDLLFDRWYSLLLLFAVSVSSIRFISFGCFNLFFKYTCVTSFYYNPFFDVSAINIFLISLKPLLLAPFLVVNVSRSMELARRCSSLFITEIPPGKSFLRPPKLRIRFIPIGCLDDGDIKEKLLDHTLFRTIDPERTRLCVKLERQRPYTFTEVR